MTYNEMEIKLKGLIRDYFTADEDADGWPLPEEIADKKAQEVLNEIKTFFSENDVPEGIKHFGGDCGIPESHYMATGEFLGFTV